MAAYNKEVILGAYEEAGKPPYSTYHAKQKKAEEAEGRAYPALATFKKMLVEAGMLEEKGKQNSGEGIPHDVWKDDDYEEFLLSYLPEVVRQNLESCYLKWQNQKLKEELAKLKGR